jgi:membrane protein involved in colicin uptake
VTVDLPEPYRRRLAEEAARRQEAERRQAEEARRQAEEAARRQEAERRQAEEERREAEESARWRAEEVNRMLDECYRRALNSLPEPKPAAPPSLPPKPAPVKPKPAAPPKPDRATEEKAGRELRLAWSMRKDALEEWDAANYRGYYRLVDKVKERYWRIVESYPGTEAAEYAKARLAGVILPPPNEAGIP